ncbi:hypothetical protein FB45DRAFT_1093981 [Roridomyces roridus]|uniref:Uncharacterized protein n=1 Tax=Roridomyces roridus TaxID=1738132 RepID=A0AAD7BG83_9AGAR|nr:hypothetical protein FB45DRAFT_1093981 [Roridomyces roridus]
MKTHWEQGDPNGRSKWQSAAALLPKCPKSPLFRLPAFKNRDVANWMKTTFPSELALLQAKEGSPEAILQVENAILRRALEDLHKLASKSDSKLDNLAAMIERRTAVLSPAKGFSSTSYHHAVTSFSSPSTPPRTRGPASTAPIDAATTSPIIIHVNEQMQETGTYESLEADGATSMGAFVNESPKTPGVAREPTQVDLHLPKEAFYKPGDPMGIVPPFFGQKSVRWQDVLPLIVQPCVCWPLWKPKSVDSYVTVDDIWASWIDGAPVMVDGTQKRKNPPLMLAEQYLGNRWRTPEGDRERNAAAQHWARYREIPEWIAQESHKRGCSPADVIKELEAMRVVDGQKKGLNFLQKRLSELRKEAAKAAKAANAQQATVAASSPALNVSADTVSDPGQSEATLDQTEAAVPTRKRACAADARRAASKKLKT